MKNVTCKNGDFLLTKPEGKYRGIKFILLGPSCSGSGMLTNFLRDANYNTNHDI